MRSTGERPALLGGRIRLQQENFLDDLLDVRLLSGEAPLRGAFGHSEPAGQGQHHPRVDRLAHDVGHLDGRVEHERQRADERTEHTDDHDEPARGENPAPHRARSALVQRRRVSCDG